VHSARTSRIRDRIRRADAPGIAPNQSDTP
jgi:hypothetical protein